MVLEKRPIQLVKRALSVVLKSNSLDTAVVECVQRLNAVLGDWDICCTILIFEGDYVNRYDSYKRPIYSDTIKISNRLKPFASVPTDGFSLFPLNIFHELYGDDTLTHVFHVPFQLSWGKIHWAWSGIGCGELVGGSRRISRLMKLCRRMNIQFTNCLYTTQKRALVDAHEAQELVYSFAHEIKSPLQQLLMLTETKATSQEIKRVVAHTKNMVHDVLAHTKTVAIRPSIWTVTGLMEELALYYAHHYKAAHIEWGCKSVEIYCDRNRLLQCSIAVIDNALEEQSESSRIWFNCIVTKEAVEIEIINSGTPIPKDHRKTIFEPYITYKQSGTGLGLPMARRVMRAMGGDLTLKSSAAEHTLFSLSISL